MEALSPWRQAHLPDDHTIDWIARYVEACLQQWGRRPTVPELKQAMLGT